MTGRLGEGGQGIVYLATAPDGTKVALKLLRADLAGDREASERFVREVAMARRVAPFCTAQVIETGLFGGRPYIVSEFIDGPTLAEVVRTQGPREGASLHRLAIGTVTALVAIHQAGIVHRDFKPSNVVLASDGPRVIDFGIAKARDLTSTLTGAVVGTPAFMAPEQLSGSSPGPKSDMFAWACTLLYAASGQPPFGQDSLPAVINRIMHTEPDVGAVQDPALRTLVTDCLAKDPDRRPAANDALMRLLGHAPAPQPAYEQPGLLQQGSAAAASRLRAPHQSRAVYPHTQPGRRRATGWIIAGSVAGALVLAAAGTFVAVRLGDLQGRTTSPTPTVAMPDSSGPATTGGPTTGGPTEGTVTLPGTSVEIEERADDPIRLASYTTGSGKSLYVRQHASGAFTRDRRYFDYALDPGSNRALGTDVDYSADYHATVSIIDHATDAKRVVKLSRKPVFPTTPRWSPDGRYGLVTLYKGADGDTDEHGYGIIDIAEGTGRTFPIKEEGAGEWRFFWNADSRSVGTWVGGKMTFYDLNGKRLRTLRDAGSPVWVEGDDVSPSGDRFLAHCTSARTSLCARPTSGDDTGVVTVPFASKRLIGWWDDEHLAVWRAKGSGHEAVVIDLSGRVSRVLATAPEKAEFGRMGFRFSRNPS
ncbi:serine/threonine-protein kinase [Nonomuraea diastatica]|uniref:serine/threonine-protein kinase n=1 Tax=Nonomuraea diastatica TaxID=1848329 RepID=UPI001FEA7ED8|nr:serine/threonine-protein kinase [Nonomuraea diastatica]